MTALGSKTLPTITRREWQELRVEDGSLSEAQADRLHGLAVQAARQLSLPETGVLTRTHHGLRAQQVTGILSIPGLTVEILPKIEGEDGAVRSALIRMLAVAYDLRVSEGELSSLQTQRRDLLELLIRLFCERLFAAVKHGLSRQYQEREDDLPVFRGSLLVKRQLTIHAARPDRLACRYDELNENTPINRVLKTAVLRLAKIARTSENLRRLDELVSRLEHAGTSARPLAEPVRLDRTNTAFHSVYGLAKLFLSGDWQSTASGGPPGFSLLFPMNDLFEKFIGRSLKRALSPLPVRLQDRRHYALRHLPGGAGAFSLRPDLVVETEYGPLIVDTKWKLLDPSVGTNHGISQADVYQMLAYAHAYGAHRLILLYPWDSHLSHKGVIQRWTFSGTNRVLEAAAVDVGDPGNASQQLKSIIAPA